MSAARQSSATDNVQIAPQVREVVRRYWGFDRLRPLQAEAIAAALTPRDSLVVLPTGGGKSLCYQAPPLVDGTTDVVVSPLIALMKDQVDSLTASGISAAALHSGLTAEERREVEFGMAEGAYRLLFVAPERLLTPGFLNWARRQEIRRFAIDEAHCISQWGHDFRPEYRQLAVLREHFPKATLHAFTATATPRVREDIAHQLHLRDPAILVGRFDRPNLIYRIVPQVSLVEQCLQVIGRHKDEAVIVYCLSRKDTEAMAGALKEQKIKAAHYHAGMDNKTRHKTQERFAQEKLDVVVATVAFGMGIDRSNVRCVLHAALPKSLESYQQETGRAGRDGLEAECVLLYTPADVMRWEGLIRRSSGNAEQPEEVTAAQFALLRSMQRYASSVQCRHKSLSEYFGQTYEIANCGACDICLSEAEGIEDATVTAQKILSCVARTGQRFGVGHVADVLLGAKTEAIRRLAHDELSTYGLLADISKKELQSAIYQLIDQGYLGRSEGDRPVLVLNEASWRVMRSQTEVRILRPKKQVAARTGRGQKSWEGADQGLFEHLRAWRREIADERGVPPYVVLHDNTLLELARNRPTRLDTLRQTKGIGERRLADLGESLISTIGDYCRQTGATTDVVEVEQPEAAPSNGKTAAAGRGSAAASGTTSKSIAKSAAYAMFADGKTVDEVAGATGRAKSTTWAYLAEYVAEVQPASLAAWVDQPTYDRICAATDGSFQRLKQIYEALGGEVPYEAIRLVLAHRQASEGG